MKFKIFEEPAKKAEAPKAEDKSCEKCGKAHLPFGSPSIFESLFKTREALRKAAEEEAQKERIKNAEVSLRLVNHRDGEIAVVAVDSEGEAINCGNLLIFQANGKVHFCAGVNPGLGFPLDPDGELFAE